MKGRKQVRTLTSAERGTLFTVVICMSATATYIHGHRHFSMSSRQGTVTSFWLDAIESFRKVGQPNPSLLIMDGHRTHIQTIPLIEKARYHGILCLPPHCSHRIQRLTFPF